MKKAKFVFTANLESAIQDAIERFIAGNNDAADAIKIFAKHLHDDVERIHEIAAQVDPNYVPMFRIPTLSANIIAADKDSLIWKNIAGDVYSSIPRSFLTVAGYAVWKNMVKDDLEKSIKKIKKTIASI